MKTPTKKDYPYLTMKQKYALYNIETIGYLDIETSGLTADFDVMLSWANCIRDVKTGKRKIEHDVVTKKDFNLAYRKSNADLVDKRITQSVIKTINKCDLVIGHWFIGKHRHDIPFIRSRCVINHVSGFPQHRQIRYADTQKYGSLLYRLHNNGLDSIARMFNLSVEKTRLDAKIWKNARIGVPSALRYILKHNLIDVKLTADIHQGMERYVPIAAIYA